MEVVRIDNRMIGKGHPCFIVAEAGVNHNGDPAIGYELITEAARCGADAVKFQTFRADQLVTRSAPKAAYQRWGTDPGESQYEMLKRLEFSETVHRQLVKRSEKVNILFMSSVFDDQSADLLEALEVPVFKIPSGEITNLPLLSHVAAKKRPMIMSTGMSTLGEIEEAVKTIKDEGNSDLILLHCVSSYPAECADVNLRAIRTLAMAFDCPVGYSDHTSGIEVALGASALGACIIEKHFTLDRNMPGPDHKASLEPLEFMNMVSGIRKVESAMGNGRKAPVSSELDTAAVARKSLVAACDIPEGTVLTDGMISVKRPGSGMTPNRRKFILGRRASRCISAGTLIGPEMLK